MYIYTHIHILYRFIIYILQRTLFQTLVESSSEAVLVSIKYVSLQSQPRKLTHCAG